MARIIDFLKNIALGKESLLIKHILPSGLSQKNLFGEVLSTINAVIMTLFGILYAYQFIIIIISIFNKPKKFNATDEFGKYAFITCARNEEGVITQFINSIKSLNYPLDKILIYVVADNCTDNTAKIAESLGAKVIERFDEEFKGKSYALDVGIKYVISQDDADITGYIILDTDNILDSNYLLELNSAYQQTKRDVITTYRNSSNIGKSIWAFGTGYCFLRECDLLHKGRMLLNLGAYVSGTGFFISTKLAKSENGWNYHKLIEDIEFSINYTMSGGSILYVHDAIFYDEQPISFKDSWNQRTRWVKGLYQCFSTYFFKLFKTLFSKKEKINKFNVFESLLFATPIPTFTFCWLIIYGILSSLNFAFGSVNIYYFLNTYVSTLIDFFLTSYFLLTLMCILISISSWKRLKCSNLVKIFYPFIFFFYIITYVPILLLTPFMKVKWKSITHHEQTEFKEKE